MAFEDFLANAAEVMGTTSTIAGIVLSLVISIMLLLIVAIATKGKAFEYTSLMMGLFTTVLFTAMSWYPLWTGAVIALAISLLAAWHFSRVAHGGSD